MQRRDEPQQQRRVPAPSHTREFFEELRIKAEHDVREGRAYAAAAKRGEVDGQRQWGHLPHLVLTALTAGLWAPVWIWVSIRDERAMGRSSVVRDARSERGKALDAMHTRHREQRKAFQRQQRQDAKEQWRELGRRVSRRR